MRPRRLREIGDGSRLSHPADPVVIAAVPMAELPDARHVLGSRSAFSNNMLKRGMREIRRRTRVVGSFPDGRSALMLVGGRLRHVAGTRWGARPYTDMSRITEQET